MAREKRTAVLKLESLYRHHMGQLRWGPASSHADDYYPSVAGRRVCTLSPAATEFIIQWHRGRNHKKATLILVEPEGDIRRGQIQVFEDWVFSVKIALDEGNYIYNARTKKCSRPVWSALAADRTLSNMAFEPVRLVPDQQVYDEKLPSARARLFALEE